MCHIYIQIYLFIGTFFAEPDNISKHVSIYLGNLLKCAISNIILKVIHDEVREDDILFVDVGKHGVQFISEVMFEIGHDAFIKSNLMWLWLFVDKEA